MSKFEPSGITHIIPERSLRAFVQTVLPTIYDDSLSYYELLSKVVKHLNSIADNINILSENQRVFIEQFTTYANDVLATKDEVQNAITESKQYADTKAQEIYSYTDGHLNTLSQYVDSEVGELSEHFEQKLGVVQNAISENKQYTDTKVQEIYSYTDGHLNTLSQYVDSETHELSEYFEQKLDEIREKLSFAFTYNVNTNELSEDAKDIVAAIGNDKVTYCIVKENGKDDIYCYYCNSSFDSNNDETLHFAGEIIENGVCVGTKTVNIASDADASQVEGVTVNDKRYADWNAINFIDFDARYDNNSLVLVNYPNPGEVYIYYRNDANKEFCVPRFRILNNEGYILQEYYCFDSNIQSPIASNPNMNHMTFTFYLANDFNGYNAIEISGRYNNVSWLMTENTEYNALLPRVTSADNGNTAVVLNGAWNKTPLPYVTPEMFGAVGDGVANDTESIRTALNSGHPVHFTGTYLVTDMITLTDKEDIVIVGGNFIFNTNGQKDFLYALRCKSLSIIGANVVCTDGGYVFGNPGGTFARSLYTPRVEIRDCSCSGINMFYRSNYVLTNDDTQYFMDSIIVDGLVSKDTICPVEVGFCRSVNISKIKSFSNGTQRELIYVTGGIYDLSCSDIWSEANTRFAFHFNNNSESVTPNNTLRQNWVEHFSLSNSTFLASDAKSIVDPMCPIGTCSISNVFAGNHIFRSYAAPNNSCQCENIIISNSNIISPFTESGGGNIQNVMIDNCVMHDILDLGSENYPANITIKGTNLVFPSRPNLGCLTWYGDMTIANCRLKCDVETVALHVLYLRSNSSSLKLTDCYLDFVGINRVIYNTANQNVIAVNNNIKCATYGSFTQQTPTSCRIKGNTINMVDVPDVSNAIEATQISLNTNAESIAVGDSFDIIPTITPANSDYKDCVFNNPNNTIVSVSKTVINGKVAFHVTALASGTANITVRVRDNTSVNTVCAVTVT